MKRILSLVLAFCIIANMLPMHAYAAESSSTGDPKRYEAVFQFDDSSDETEMNSVLVIDDCVYADIHWIAEQLNLKINENTQGHYLPERYKGSTNRVIQNMVSGYDSCFKDVPDGIEYVLSKPDIDLQFYFRDGSSKMYAYSEYLGKLATDLGGSIVNLPDEKNEDHGKTWVPLVMFLNIFDSSFWIDDSTIHVLPCALTAVDVLHTPNLGELFYDPVVDGGIDNTISNVKKGYIIFYNKVKKLFQGLVHLNPKDVLSSLSTHDYEEMSNALALQLCTPNQSELEMLNSISANTGSAVLRDYSTLISTGDQVDAINDELELADDGVGVIFDLLSSLSETVKKGTAVKADDLLAHLSGADWDAAFENADEVSKAVKKAADAASAANTASKWASGIKYTGDAVSLAAPIFLSYITSANEISSSVQAYNNAVQKYVSEFSICSSVYMPAEIIDVLNQKSKMYQNQDTSVFNDELTLKIADDALFPTVGFSAQLFFQNYYTSFFNTLGQLQLVSAGWDLGEWLANGVSGGAFDSMNALNNSTAALMLEYDSAQVVNSFKKRNKNHYLTPLDLATYKDLELVRLKSYLIAREDVLSYYKYWEKKKPDQFPYAEAEITKDEDAILSYMAALLAPNSGATKETLDAHAKSLPLMNKLIIASDALCDDPLKAFANQNQYHYGDSFSYYAINMESQGGYIDYDQSETPEGAVGYSIMDFDSDGADELLILSFERASEYGNYTLCLSMYEKEDSHVKLSAQRKLDQEMISLPIGAYASNDAFSAFLDCFIYEESGIRIAVESADLASLFADGCEYHIAAYTYTGEQFAVQGSECCGGSDFYYDKQFMGCLADLGLYLNWNDYIDGKTHIRNHAKNYQCLLDVCYSPVCAHEDIWDWREAGTDKIKFVSGHILSEGEMAEQTQNTKYEETPLPNKADQAFVSVLEDIIFNDRIPNGSILEYDHEYNYIGDNQFAVYDIDGDGSEELLFDFSNTYSAEQTLLIFKYNSKSESVDEEFACFPSVSFYGTNYIMVYASHNQSPSEFWPYILYKYDKKSDTYQEVASVSAFDKSMGSYANTRFPYEIDKDNNGRVFFIGDDSKPVDDSDYEQWINSYIGGQKEVKLEWKNLYEDEIYALLY